MQMWENKEPSFNKTAFLDLFNNVIPFIAIDHFLSPDTCERLRQQISTMGLNQYDYNFEVDKAPSAEHLFETHYLYEQKTPEEYFPAAARSIAEYENFCNAVDCDPVSRVQALLQKQMGLAVTIAEQEGQQYSYAIIRELKNSALLHADFAHYLASYWSISQVVAQYAWNIYLSDPGEGGETLVYNKPWEKSDDQYLLEDTYGYNVKVVAGREFVQIKPQPGKLVLFNSRNFHEVKASKNPRLAIGGHVGLTEDNKVIMWV